MKKLLLVLVSAVLISGCSAINTLGDFINENELLTSAAARHAVSHYIAAGDTIEAENNRARQIETRLTRVLAYVEGNPAATTDDLMTLVESTIDWSQLDTKDKLLVQDILMLLEKELDKYDSQERLKESTMVALRGLFNTAISAAQIYLSRG